MPRRFNFSVIPTKAGTQMRSVALLSDGSGLWVPAFAGMTSVTGDADG